MILFCAKDGFDEKIINVVLPTAPKASRDYDDIADKVPKDPPFIAYLSNLPYDIDEEEISLFFKNMRIANMRIPKSDRLGDTPKLKGYGYVEFEDRESLMSALIIPDTTLKNRRIRIEIAENAENDRRRGGRMGISDRMGSADTGGDWRSSNRPEPSGDDRRGGFTRDNMRNGSRDYGGFKEREGGFSRERDSVITRNRDQPQQEERFGGGSGGSWRDARADRDGDSRGFSRPNFREDREERRDGDNRGFSRSNFREDREEKRGSGFRRFDDRDRDDRNGYNRNRGDRGDRGEDRNQEQSDASDSGRSASTAVRPKLQLAPRTKPLEQQAAGSASIFGSAKPVDTSERDRQIEEKLLRVQEERLRDKGSEESGERRPFDRSRPLIRRNDVDKEAVKERDVTPEEKSGDDNRSGANSRSEHRSPDDKQKVEKVDRPKRDEKRDRPEKEMPKMQEPEPPNFQASNKFAVLPDDEGF